MQRIRDVPTVFLPKEVLMLYMHGSILAHAFLPHPTQPPTMIRRGRNTISPRVRLAIVQMTTVFWEADRERFFDVYDLVSFAGIVTFGLIQALVSAEAFVFRRSARICDRYITQVKIEHDPRFISVRINCVDLVGVIFGFMLPRVVEIVLDDIFRFFDEAELCESGIYTWFLGDGTTITF